MGKTYVVFVGRKSSIYDNWVDAQEQINGFSGASHKRYSSKEEAFEAFEKYMEKRASSSTSTTTYNSTTKNACPSSTSTATASATATVSASSSRKQKQNEKIAHLVEAEADIAREHQRNALRMMEISEELKLMLESLHFSDDE